MIPMLLMLLLLLPASVTATLDLFFLQDQTQLKVIAFNGLPWPFEFQQNSVSLPLIAIDEPSENGEYNPCDESTFRIGAMDSALEKWAQEAQTVTSDESSSFDVNGWNATGRPWIAYLDVDRLAEACKGVQLHLHYSSFLALSAQKLGAKGLIVAGNNSPALTNRVMPAGVQRESQVVHTTTITIPVVMAENDEKSEKMRSLLSGGALAVVEEMEKDPNPFDGLWQRFGWYHMLMIGMAIYSFGLSVYTLKQSVAVVQHYRDGNQSRPETMAFLMRMLILIPEFIGGLVGVAAYIDPFGVFLINDYYLARTVANSRAVIVGTTDIILIFYCNDIYNAFKLSRTNGRFVAFFVKHCWGLPVIVVFGVAMVGMDLGISYWSLRGAAGANVHLIPVMYLLVLYLIGTIILFVLSENVRREVGKVNVSKGVVNPLVKKTVESTLLMRKYMIVSALGRIGNMFCFVYTAMGWYRLSVASYICFVFLLIGVPSFISSTAQILIAVEITPSTSRASATARKSAAAVSSISPARSSKIRPSPRFQAGGRRARAAGETKESARPSPRFQAAGHSRTPKKLSETRKYPNMSSHIRGMKRKTTTKVAPEVVKAKSEPRSPTD